jgi:hypothetical protein
VKYFYPVIITVLIFMAFSCTSQSQSVQPPLIPESSISVNDNEISKTPEPEVPVEPVFEEKPAAEIFEKPQEIAGTVVIDEPLTELVIEPPQISQAVQQPSQPQERPSVQEQQPVQQPSQLQERPPVQQVAQQPSQQQERPPVQQAAQPAQRPSQPQERPPVQQAAQPAQQPSQPQERPPVQQTVQPAQQPSQPHERPPARQTVQPQVQQSVQSPALLGSAEERNPVTERESPPALSDPLRNSVIDSTVRDQNVTPAMSIIVPQEGDIVFSRVIRATVGQIVEVPFNGTGWVYLGELASRRGIVYNSRRLDPEGQSFIFRAEEAGVYALKFFKQDFIRDYILNDHVQVVVGDAPVAEGAGWFNPPVDRGRVVAQPRWPSAQAEAEILRGGTAPGSNTPPVNIPDRVAGNIAVQEMPQVQSQERGNVPVQPSVQSAQGTASAQPSVQSAQGTTSAQPSVQSPSETRQPAASAPNETREILAPDVLLQRAKENFDSGNVAAAVLLLDQYAQNYTAGTDELYWLYGQFYEANSPVRNILLSLDYYRRLVNEYPQSTRYNDARRRIAYLERFYINIQ